MKVGLADVANGQVTHWPMRVARLSTPEIEDGAAGLRLGGGPNDASTMSAVGTIAPEGLHCLVDRVRHGGGRHGDVGLLRIRETLAFVAVFSVEKQPLRGCVPPAVG